MFFFLCDIVFVVIILVSNAKANICHNQKSFIPFFLTLDASDKHL